MPEEPKQLPAKQPVLGWVTYYLAHDGVVVTESHATQDAAATTRRVDLVRGKPPTALWVVPVYVLSDDRSEWVPVEEAQPIADEDDQARASLRSRKLTVRARQALGR